MNTEPVPASRPRFTRNGKTYNEAKYAKYKKSIEELYRKNFDNKQIFDRGEPLKVELHFYRGIQKSISKKEHGRRAMQIVKPALKPDIDNYTKAVLDGLKKAWFDDGQIVEIHATKDYDEQPRVEVTIEKINS
ncbi:RusA family crossover junction endodeoxyribonuclease [Companilactobacillus tucceti]|nr:RusA family crossover junction endodeoxyribonuclease [Companilactobacillus tucceti]